MNQKIGLPGKINKKLNLLKRHLPYHESDHILNMAYNTISDGTISPTTGQCKEGMNISCDGQWGYHRLVVSLAQTREALFIVNRSGNEPSHTDSPVWIDKSLDLVADIFEKVYVRGDTDFSLTRPPGPLG